MSLFNEKKDGVVENGQTAAPVTPAAEEKKEPVTVVETPKNEIGFISSGTKIEGNITSTGHLVLNGEVTGSTVVDGNVVLNGVALGDIECSSLLIDKATSNSNITATNNVIVKAGTVVTGNVNCKNITVYGTVEGDIVAKGGVVLKSSAVVNGNIDAARIGIESGAKLKGAVNIK